MGTQDKKYFAFISYKSEDVEWAVWLQHELEYYHLPSSYNGREDIRQDLRPIFRDIDELRAGNLPEQIQQALKDSENLIVICSPQSAKSPWVNDEVKTFISLERTNKIFPFIVEGNSPQEFFPPALLALPKEQERLGGDVSKNGRDAAFVKIVAGMLNVEYNSLWNRYEKEKAEQERLEREKRDNLLRVQSRFIAEKAKEIADNDCVYLGKKLLLEVLPKDIENPNRPYTPEAENALRYVCAHFSSVLKGHTDSTKADYSHDGRRILSFSQDKTIRIWDIATGETIIVFNGHRGYVDTAVFSHDDKRILSTSQDGTIRIWEIKSGKEQMVLENHKLKDISLDRKYFLSLSKDNKLHVWEIETGKTTEFSDGHSDRIDSATFSPDGKFIVSRSKERTIVWDTMTGDAKLSYAGDTSMDFSPDGRHAAITDSTSSFQIIDLTTGATINKCKKWKDRIYSVFYSPDGKHIISEAGNIFRVWDAKTGKERKTIEGMMFWTFSPDGQYMVMTSNVSILENDNLIHVYDLYSGKKLMLTGHKDRIDIVVYSPDGRYIASSSMPEENIRIWDAGTGRLLKVLEGHSDWIQSVSFSPDGNYVVSAGGDKTIRIWEILSQPAYKQYKASSFSYGGRYAVLQSKERTIVWDTITGDAKLSYDENAAIDISTDGKYAALIVNNDLIQIINLKTKKIVRKLKGQMSNVFSAVFSHDSKLLISTSADDNTSVWDYGNNTMRIWKVSNGKEFKKMQMPPFYQEINSTVFSLDNRLVAFTVQTDIDVLVKIWNLETEALIQLEAENFYAQRSELLFSPNGKFLLATGGESIPIWDVETGENIKTLEGHSGIITSAVFSPDGKRVVSASYDYTIRIWDVETGKELNVLENHTDVVDAVTFSPDGKYIASASTDNTIRIWNAEVGSQIAMVQGQFKGFNAITFTSNGSKIVSASNDQFVRVWDFPALQDLIDQTREQFKDYPLTPEERKKYYLD